MQLPAVVEALLISSEKPLKGKQIAELVRAESAQLGIDQLKTVDSHDVAQAVSELNESYKTHSASYSILSTPNGWQIHTAPEFSSFIQRLAPEKKPKKLNQATLETLAIVAYKQPITKATAEAIRGVSCDAPIKKLLELGILADAGPSDLPGAPKLYQTTATFFDYLGISDINELPNLEELRESQASTST